MPNNAGRWPPLPARATTGLDWRSPAIPPCIYKGIINLFFDRPYAWPGPRQIGPENQIGRGGLVPMYLSVCRAVNAGGARFGPEAGGRVLLG